MSATGSGFAATCRWSGTLQSRRISAFFGWVVDGQLPLSGLYGTTSSFVILISAILQKPEKGSTGLSPPAVV